MGYEPLLALKNGVDIIVYGIVILTSLTPPMLTPPMLTHLGYCGTLAGCGYCTTAHVSHIHAASSQHSVNENRTLRSINIRKHIQ